jgi:hypothetical protein
LVDDKLRESGRMFVDAMLPGDRLALVRFDDTAGALDFNHGWKHAG